MFTFSQMADVKNYRNKAKVKDLYIYIFFQLVTFENRPPRVCFFFVFPPPKKQSVREPRRVRTKDRWRFGRRQPVASGRRFEKNTAVTFLFVHNNNKTTYFTPHWLLFFIFFYWFDNLCVKYRANVWVSLILDGKTLQSFSFMYKFLSIVFISKTSKTNAC